MEGPSSSHTPSTQEPLLEAHTQEARPSNLHSMDISLNNQNAVEVVSLYKSYGRGKNKLSVLENLKMTVPCGAIYGLLGPSGCGKTTLLRCIIGRLSWDQGCIQSLGQKPGSIGHPIPGASVGYMPQELALFQEFTIGETLSYFGRLHKMTSAQVSQRTEFLLEFLHLPEKGRIIRELSGGQQRRTSFAIALLQEPRLLVLDEPTVGVDPLLRQRIWQHLLTIAKTSSTTIVITTHYVEEARQAHMVGLMRNGRLLAEAPPTQLLDKYSLPTLEDVFLELCERDQVGDIEQNEDRRDSSATKPMIVTKTYSDDANPEELVGLLHRDSVQTAKLLEDNPEKKITKCERCRSYLPSPMNILALFIKNVTILKRQLGFLLFEFMLPSLQIIMFCLCIGQEPFGLKLAVVNNETCQPPPVFPIQFAASCLFLTNIDSHSIIQKDFGRNFSDAIDTVKRGENWGVINIGSNFTLNLLQRYASPGNVTNKTLEGSTVHVHLDMTNQQIAVALQAQIMTAFERFSQVMLTNLSMNPDAAGIPVKIEEPVYGSLTPSFTNFMAPGIILSITFFMATGLTAMSFVLERKQGLLDRSFVAGVSNVEVMIGHIATQSLVMLVQVALLLIFAIAVFKVVSEGSLVLVVILTLFQGLVGMSLGLLISTLCTEETSAIQCALGSVYPNMLLSGIIWPLEGMPVWLRYFSYCLPMTFAAEAMRSILARGWGLTFMPVWRGFVMSIGWGWLIMFLSAVVLYCKRQ